MEVDAAVTKLTHRMTPDPLTAASDDDRRSPAEVLAAASGGRRRIMLQDFRPVPDALEWRLSHSFWAEQGTRPFVQSAVPYVINNSGWLAEQAAHLTVVHCLEFPDDPVNLLELGAGSGLFARQFIQAFDEICRDEGLDFHERLRFYVTDASAASVRQWRANGQFDAFGGRVIVGVCDATAPADPADVDGRPIDLPPLRATFLNYALDSLPMTVLRRREGEPVEVLCMRTFLHERPERVAELTGLSVEDAQAIAETGEELHRLLPLLPAFEFEVAFRPAEGELPPHAEEALAFSGGRRTMLNHAALDALQAMLAISLPDGFVLFNDYGPIRREEVADVSYTQRFGGSTAACINFPFVEQFFASRSAAVYRPDNDGLRQIHSRLLARHALDRTGVDFVSRFGDARIPAADRGANAAIEHVTAGRYDEALVEYQNAIDFCPRDWHLLANAAEFLTQQLERPADGLALARRALAVNPWYGAFLWNTYGNALFRLGRHAEAHTAYVRAAEIDPADAQAHMNLAFSLAHQGRFEESLAAIARGLATDQAGRFRPHLLEKQQQVLAALAGKWSAEQLRTTNRHRAFTGA